MDLLVDWAYGNYKGRLGYKQRLSLFHASHRLQVHDLMFECKRALKSSVNSETYPLLTDLAQELNCQELEQVGFLAPFPVCTQHVQCMQPIFTFVQSEELEKYAIRLYCMLKSAFGMVWQFPEVNHMLVNPHPRCHSRSCFHIHCSTECWTALLTVLIWLPFLLSTWHQAK